jgi:hypothetical protein
MGNSSFAVNLDKREYLSPDEFECGSTFQGQVGAGMSVADAVAVLICASDFADKADVVWGRWAGDRVVFVDEASQRCHVPGLNPQEVYRNCVAGRYINIAEAVRVTLYESIGTANFVSQRYLPRASSITQKVLSNRS